jgi:hypothetical protein
MSEYENLEYYLEQALEGIIECDDCGNSIEPDCAKCHCGWLNPVVGMGLI